MASKFEHLKAKKKKNSFPLSPIFEIHTNYKSISLNISIGKKKVTYQNKPEKYIHPNYVFKKMEYSKSVTI